MILQRAADRFKFYTLAVKMVTVAKERGLRLIMENPWTLPHYLKDNFPIAPAWIDNNRMLRGDYFVKPTAYWFVNCEPTHGFTLQNDKHKKIISECKGGKAAGICSEERSMISPDYARNFLCDKVLGITQEINNKQLTLF